MVPHSVRGQLLSHPSFKPILVVYVCEKAKVNPGADIFGMLKSFSLELFSSLCYELES